MNPTRRRLREATGAAHARVDAAFGGFDLGRRGGYVALLAAHDEALRPIEARLDASDTVPVIADWPARRRSAALAADLTELGHSAPAPAAAPPTPFASVAAVAGTLYVLEGSRLGGRLLSRSVAPGMPTRYLDAEQPSEKWRELLEKLDQLLYLPTQLDIAVDAALDAFDRFEAAGTRWLGRMVA
ncbi:biliverdin-producing heme oxygenase [Sphingomonas sp. RS6]